MSPGGDERTDLRQVGESTASLFCSGPTTTHEPPGPTWGWIVLAASLVLLDDVSAYFKRIGARKGYQGYHSYQVDRSGRLAVPNEMVAEIPIVFVARALAAMRLHGIPGSRHSRRKETYVFLPEWRRAHRAIESTTKFRHCRPGGGGYRAELFIHRGISPVRARARTTFFFHARDSARARAAASSFSTFLIIIYNWTARAEETSRDR
ncbi:hypothetical protein ALC62_13696 [Cyphomyrmex costatus]|uniref:Uncharacterized protein n=1 Tax=Cyphomyrmex costatus TaxID=456900 RepID=A0A195C5X6_9HYME|nr:hypothetical protein ALC62_13696 [Cyphomyrmex costatus]